MVTSWVYTSGMFTQPYSSNSLTHTLRCQILRRTSREAPVFDGEVLKALLQLGKVQVRSEEALGVWESFICQLCHKLKIQLNSFSGFLQSLSTLIFDLMCICDIYSI